MGFPERLMIEDERIYTQNIDPGHRVYGERLVIIDGSEHREWSPHRSKLSAYIRAGGKYLPFNEDSNILYLGAASGTTASHISDIVTNGRIYCVEFSQRTFRDLVRTCERRKNMIPVLGDARHPESYGFAVEDVDLVYQDVAQKRQPEILMNNMEWFSADDGMLCLKSRSEDVTADPEEMFERSCKEFLGRGFTISDARSIEPFERDHAMIVVRR